MSGDPFYLARFIEAQDGVYERALKELRAGAKQSHWMWFIFPQNVELGRSPMATLYGIRSIEEARAYLAHPLLGMRLRECLAALEDVPLADAVAVFGTIDAAKFRSSLTLFEQAGGGAVFDAVLERWFDGKRDPAVLALL
jgi:uncharacterized protein (DUF1810 family)